MNTVDLKLNFIPVKFSSSIFKGCEIPYLDAEGLKALRKKYYSTHVFRRKGNTIQCVPLTESAENLGEEKVFRIEAELGLTKHLVQDALVRFFKEKKVKIRKIFGPMKFVLENENLMKEVAGDCELATLLPIYPEYELEAGVLAPYKKPLVFGLLIKFSVKRMIEATINDLVQRKIDVQNLYVEADSESEHYDGIVEAKYRRKLAGKISSIEGSTVKLTDFSDKDEFESQCCYLEPSPANLKHCLNALAPGKVEQLKDRFSEQIFKVKGAKNQFERLRKLTEWLSQAPINCSKDLVFNVDPSAYSSNLGSNVGQYQQLTSANYVLRPGGSITVRKVDEAIEEKGPFDTESFPKKKVRVAVIFPKQFKGDVEIFIRQFKDGVPPHARGKRIPFTQGFIRKYRLTSCDFELYPIEGAMDNSGGFKQASLEALRSPQAHDVAIVVIREEFHNLHGENNPYLVAKSTFMSHGIPVQEVEIETVRDEYGRPYILNNIALAVYAKLGGIPWVLSSTPGMTHELIFGIGSAQVQTQRFSKSERVVGITTVFNGDGNYLLYNVSKDVPYKEYQGALLESLKDCLNEIKARYAWQPKDNVRLIFHQSFKKFKDVEAQAVKDFVESITDYKVEYAFVHISREHQWTIFDTKSEGASHWVKFKEHFKGQYVPHRGFCIPLGMKAALLSLSGPQQLKTHLQGCPEPILFSIHRESTFTSQEYLINQIYKFTFMSWKSFFPSTMPVTIAYSDMIAKLMGQLRDVSNWNPEILSTKLRESRWFL